MRYSEYLRQLTRLEKNIAAYTRIEAKAVSGQGALLTRLFPRMRQSKIEAVRTKRAALCREHGELVSGYFGGAVQNVNMWAAMARGMSTSHDTIAFLRNAAEAARGRDGR
jgi:hypothetical protein